MPESPRPNPDMSDYEATAWNRILERVQLRENRRQFKIPQKFSELADTAVERVQKFFEDHDNVKVVAETMARPFIGLQRLLERTGISSVSEKRVLRRAARRDQSIRSLSDLRGADLEIPDSLLSTHTLTYSAVMAVEGAATSLAVTGFVVSSSVSAGTTLAAAAAAVAADVTANITVAARLVAATAISYGYDPRLPEEQIYALGVLNYGTTLTAGGKAASLAELSRLVQTMMRHPTHAELDNFVLIKVTQEFLKRLGIKATHQRLAQLIPIVGVVINAGGNARSIDVLGDRAQDVYRLRFLTEKYLLDPVTWLSEPGTADPDSDSIDLEALIREAEADKPNKDPEA